MVLFSLILLFVTMVPGSVTALAKNQESRVEMMVFVDFYCPHCHKFEKEVVSALKKEFGPRLEITTIGYPVVKKESSNLIAIFLAANELGKGEIMQNLLFKSIHEPTPDLRDTDLAGVFRAAGLDQNKVTEIAQSGKIQQKLQEGRDLAIRYGILGTPGVVVNKVRVEEHSLAYLTYLINKILNGSVH